MTSLNPNVTALHVAYLEAMGMDPEDLPMTPCFERWWFDAIQGGLTPDHIRIVVKERLAFNRKGSFHRGLSLRNLIQSDEDIAIVLDDYAQWKARQRIRVVDPAKVSVLAATGRPTPPPQTEARRAGEIELIQRLKEAVK